MNREDGSVLATAWAALAVAAVALVLVVDLTAYLAAFNRAQTAADAAALAAVGRAHPAAVDRDPAGAASRMADAHGARLEGCVCMRGTRTATVTVAVPVRAVAATRFAARTVTASARARLVSDAGGQP